MFFLGIRNDPVVYPTGLISTFVGTEVNGDKTTLHTTQRYRTYVDGSYTELLQSTSVIVPTPTLDVSSGIETTANVQRFGSLNSGKVRPFIKKIVLFIMLNSPKLYYIWKILFHYTVKNLHFRCIHQFLTLFLFILEFIFFLMAPIYY